MKRALILCLSFLLVLSCVACKPAKPLVADDPNAAQTPLKREAIITPEPTSEPTPEMTPEPTPEPTPVPPEVTLHLWQGGEEIPDFYTPVEREEFPQNPLFAFTDYLGVIRYRTPILRVTVREGQDVLRETGFAEPELNPEWTLTDDTPFLDPAEDKPGVCQAVEIDWEQYKTRNAYTRTEHPSHFTYTDEAGETRYLLYASLGGETAAYYPANEQGEALPGAIPSERDPVIPMYYPDGTPQDGERMLIVFQGSQSVAAFEGKDGQWEQIRLMACSTGRITPNGNFTVNERYRTRSLFGGKGQYATRIVGHFLFHSIPSNPYARDVDAIMEQMFLDQYEGLGTMISRGCVRVTAADAKWIYEECPRGTAVRITRDAGPACPEVPKIIYEAPYVTGDNLGWDPTDPDPRNPYNMTEEEIAKLLAGETEKETDKAAQTPETQRPKATAAPQTPTPEPTAAPEMPAPEATAAPETTTPEATAAPESSTPEATAAPETQEDAGQD